MALKKSLGVIFIALGVALPVIAYAAGHLFNVEVASHGGPPNQGAMVVAYLVIQSGLVVGACLALVGLILTMTAPKSPFDGNTKKAH